MEYYELAHNDRVALNATHALRITHEHLTETTADTDQTLTIAVAAGDLFAVSCAKLKTPFEDASDAAFDSTQITIGDGDDVDRYVAQTELNENGTEIDYIAGAAAQNGGHVYLAADTVDILIESMTAKSLSDLDAGEIWIYYRHVPLTRAPEPNG